MPRVTTAVFDIGNVLIHWNPRHLYRRLIPDPERMEWFLANVCTDAWNLEQDRGRSWAEAVAERIALFPEHEALIRAYDTGWHDMVPGAIEGSVAILDELRQAGVPVFAITNFSREKFSEAVARFPFLADFDDTIVSAEHALLKPDPAIYRLLLERHAIAPARAVFVDDSLRNVEGARAVGMAAIHFTGPEPLRDALRDLGLPIGSRITA